MKPWRQTLGGRFAYLQYDTVKLHDLQKDVPMIVDDQTNFMHYQMKLRK
jgi:hypothetical protein